MTELEINVQGIPLTSNGAEVVAYFTLYNQDNENTFWTDSNGLEMQQRILNKRPDFDFASDQVVSSNYYPVNSAIVIVDKNDDIQLTVMNDRPQGGSVIDKSSIELMVNRRLMMDDLRGVGEALNETDAMGRGIIVPVTFWI